MSRNFRELIEAKWNEGKFVCVGLDTDRSKVEAIDHLEVTESARPQLEFNCRIIEATGDLVAAFKPNEAFYAAQGAQGIASLKATISYAHAAFPDVPVILDFKRGDIGSTNSGYVEYAFDYLEADAVTVHNYMGSEAMRPFLDCRSKGIFVLCRTSNPGAGEFQDMPAISEAASRPLWAKVARKVVDNWNYNGNCGVVVGATKTHELGIVRQIVGDMPILIPGIGAQGGDLEATVRYGVNNQGGGMIINSSRGIIFASSGPDFVLAARQETLKLHDAITTNRGVKL